MDNKKALVVGIVGIVVVGLLAVVVVSMKRGASPAVSPAVDPSKQLPGGISTREAAPVNIVVPDAKATSVPANVAIPKSTAPANPNESATFRNYDIKVEGGKFVPDTIIVNQWDTVHIDLTAVDKDYDFTQADFGFKFPLPKGQTKALEFSATGQGNFLFYCTSCGGPETGPKGNLIVTVPKKP